MSHRGHWAYDAMMLERKLRRRKRTREALRWAFPYILAGLSLGFLLTALNWALGRI